MYKTFLALIFIVVFGCTVKTDFVKNLNTGNALGTTYSVIYISNQELNFQKAIDSVFNAVNQSMSTYIPNSDISKINRGDSTIVVDAMFKEVFEISKTVYEQSNGYFDPTVGVLVNAWGFGPEEQISLDSVKVDSLLQYVGWDKVKLSSDGSIKKVNPEIRFDFNAVAKGYAIDRLGVLLNTKGIDNYLVEVGGEVLAKGENLISEKKWTVGIDDPETEEGRQLKRIILLKDKAMASSGNYRKFRVDSKTGKKYVHTVNPKTGYTKNGSVLAATVLADNCAVADAYATTFMAMNLKDSKELLQKHSGLAAYIIYLDEKGITKEFMTTNFQSVVKE